nr:TPA_asm: ND6 [Crypturopus inflatus]
MSDYPKLDLGYIKFLNFSRHLLMMSTVYFVSVSLSVFFMFSPAPLVSAMVVVSQAAATAYLIYAGLATSWLSFILVLVFVSAMMVIYAYVSSLAANDFFYTNGRLVASTPLLLLALAGAMIYWPLPVSVGCFSLLDSPELVCSPLSVYKVYSPGVLVMTVFLISYLLVALVAVVKNASYCMGALRSKGGST